MEERINAILQLKTIVLAADRYLEMNNDMSNL
jgi:hypothetical protein